MKLLVSFPKGAYSSNKDNVKKVFNLLDYKYKSGNKINDNQMICIWQRGNEKIKGVFNGSGQECEFIIECNDNEVTIFNAFSAYGAVVNVPGIIDESLLIQQAQEIINKWWTPVPQYKGEPNYFFAKRKEQEARDYEWFVMRQVERLKEGI